jgi:hypothetical protein
MEKHLSAALDQFIFFALSRQRFFFRVKSHVSVKSQGLRLAEIL